MSNAGGIGVFGKLPFHGDFVSRGLPSAFVTRWDSWLQGALESSREQLGECWLDTYLCAPVWRFVLSAGVVDECSWMGVMLPSVDRVGRYFPITLAQAFGAGVPATMACLADDWFQAVESHALTALDRALDVDTLLQNFAPVTLPPELAKELWKAPEERKAWAIPLPECEAAPNGLSMLAGWLLSQKLASYSLWWSGGSEFVQPTLRVSSGLPAMSAFAALLDDSFLDGRWTSLLPRTAAHSADTGRGMDNEH